MKKGSVEYHNKGLYGEMSKTIPLGQSFFIFRFTDPPDPIFLKMGKKINEIFFNFIFIFPPTHASTVLYSKRIYSANGISLSYFSLHKCFFKTYKNAFKWNASNLDLIFQNYSPFVAASNLLVKSTFFSFLQHGSKHYCYSHSSRLQT